jgi:hypothetical protein
MDASLRIMTGTPVRELWRSDGSVLECSKKILDVEDIRDLLRLSAVEFVVADPGSALKWIPVVECRAFWKKEVRARVANPKGKVRLEDFPDEYFYLASQWRDPKFSSPIVLLEKHH